MCNSNWMALSRIYFQIVSQEASDVERIHIGIHLFFSISNTFFVIISIGAVISVHNSNWKAP